MAEPPGSNPQALAVCVDLLLCGTSQFIRGTWSNRRWRQTGDREDGRVPLVAPRAGGVSQTALEDSLIPGDRFCFKGRQYFYSSELTRMKREKGLAFKCESL